MIEPPPAQCPDPELHTGHLHDWGWCAGLDGTEVPRARP